jgi:serine/threonine protein kinase/Leucine-rich repeat (LRR) protein
VSGSKKQPEHSSKDQRSFVQPPAGVQDDVTRVDIESSAPDLHGVLPDRPKTLEQFIQLLTASRLVSAERFAKFMANLPADQRPADAASVAHALVEQELLTFYQASVLLDGRARGLVLGTYVILEKIGEGGMGVVFKARHQRMKRIVALKILPPSMTSSPDAIQRFHREVEVAARLQHPNIAAAYDAGEADGIHFLVMEYVDGPNLSSYVKQVGPLQVAVATNLVVQTARGLAHAHEQGVVHRDIKPGNLLVNSSGHVKIMDMGLAALNTSMETDVERQELTQSGRVMGTVDYMAPEQALDAKSVDFRSDIYSLGCTLHYLLAGRPMAPEGTLTQKLLWHQSEPVPSLHDVTTSVPPLLDAAFQQMLAKSPRDRQTSMTEVAEHLQSALDEMSASNLELAEVGIRLNLGSPTTDVGSRAGATVVERPTVADLGSFHFATKRSGRSKWIVGALIACVLLLLAAVTPYLLPAKYPQIEFVNLPVEATLVVNGAKVKRGETTGDDSFVYTASGPGIHSVKVTQAGFEDFATTIELKRGVLHPLEVVLAKAEQAIAPDPEPLSPEPLSPEPLSPEPLSPEPLSPEPPGPNLPATPIAGHSTDNGADAVGNANGTVDPPAAKRPHEELLLWLFENDARLGLAVGEELTIARNLEEVPDGFEVRSIRLRGAQIGDDDIAQLMVFDRTLQRLDLAETLLTDEATNALSELTALEVLDLAGTKVSNSGLAGLSRLANLRQLNLRKTKVDTQGLTLLLGLQRLEELNLSDTNVGDSAVPKLTSFPALKEVQLFGTSITQNGVLRIKELRPNLAVIWDGVDIERKVAEQLLEGGATLGLILRTGELIPDVQDAVSLPSKRFVIDEVSAGKQFGNQDLQRLSLLVSIRRLDLARSKITSLGLKLLYPMASLEDIELGTLTLADESVVALRRSLPDCSIHLKETNDRYVARWTIEQGGAVDITTPDGARHSAIKMVADLPAGRFSVVRVDLSKQQDIAAAQLASLTNLEFLESILLTDTLVGDDVLEVVARCRVVRDCRLSGTNVTPSGLASLMGNERINILALPPAAVSARSMEVICNLSNIQQLSLAGAKIESATFAKLQQLKQLNGLILDDAPLNDDHVNVLRRIKTLRNLSILRTGVTDLAVETLELALQGCRVHHDPLDAQREACKWVLEMGGAVTLTSGVITKVNQLPPRECDVVGVDLASISAIRGSGFAKHLPKLVNLLDLNLSNTDVGDREMVLVARLDKLETLGLQQVPISDVGVQQLSGLGQLKSLNLTGSLITGSGFKSLGFSNSLTSLSIGVTRVSDQTIGFVKQFPNLANLDISANTRLTDRSLEQLKSLKSLTKVDVSRTAASAAAISSLRIALPKCSVIQSLSHSRGGETKNGGARLNAAPPF